MKIVLAMVASVDGKTTKWYYPNIYAWTSKEDQTQFFHLLQQTKVVFMGRKTYEAAKSNMILSKDRLRIVFTKNPGDYTSEGVVGKIEFTNENPKTVIEKLTNKGITEAILVGGSELNSLFFQENLVNEIFLTI